VRERVYPLLGYRRERRGSFLSWGTVAHGGGCSTHGRYSFVSCGCFQVGLQDTPLAVPQPSPDKRGRIRGLLLEPDGQAPRRAFGQGDGSGDRLLRVGSLSDAAATRGSAGDGLRPTLLVDPARGGSLDAGGHHSADYLELRPDRFAWRSLDAVGYKRRSLHLSAWNDLLLSYGASPGRSIVMYPPL
jgi:hypothetical protein